MRYYGEEALGLVETKGMVPAIEAADKMLKAVSVDIISYENVASGYISVLVKGDVGACKTAVEAGVNAVVNMGAEVYSSVVIARPHPALKSIKEAVPGNNEENINNKIDKDMLYKVLKKMYENGQLKDILNQ